MRLGPRARRARGRRSRSGLSPASHRDRRHRQRDRASVRTAGPGADPRLERPDARGALPRARLGTRDRPARRRRRRQRRSPLRRGGRDEDLLLTTGGVSAGDLDLLPAAAERAGFEMLFHGVSMRPGKPVAFARRGKTSGSAFPAIPSRPRSASTSSRARSPGRLEGDAQSRRAGRCGASHAGGFGAGAARDLPRRGVARSSAGKSVVEPIASAGSHDIGAHARANALIRLPARSPRRKAGSVVDCLVLGRIESPR